MTEPAQPDGGAIGRQLIRQADAISQLRKDLDQLASEVTDTIADIVTRMETTEDQSGPAAGAVGPTRWPPGAGATWAPKEPRHCGPSSDWVGWIRNSYPLPAIPTAGPATPKSSKS